MKKYFYTILKRNRLKINKIAIKGAMDHKRTIATFFMTKNKKKRDDAIGMDDNAAEPEKPHEDVKKWITGRKRLRICQSSRAILKKQHQKENADLQTDRQNGLHCKKNSQQ